MFSNCNTAANPTTTAVAVTTTVNTNVQTTYTAVGGGGGGGLDKEKEKDKSSYGKMSHYVNEMKKELDAFQKQRKEMQLEMQRLREKCQQLEDQLTREQSKVVSLEERLERSKANQRNLLAQIDNQNLKLGKQQPQVVSPSVSLRTNAVTAVENSTAPVAVHHSINGKSDKVSDLIPDTHNKLPPKGSNISETKSLLVSQSQNTEISATESRPLQRSLSFDSH